MNKEVNVKREKVSIIRDRKRSLTMTEDENAVIVEQIKEENIDRTYAKIE